jgi:hypothetical protein
LLETLDQIDWKDLGEPRIPEWLRGLAQNNTEASGQLEDRFVYLGSETWENYGPASELLKNDVPVLIVPFLIELLGNEECNQKAFILALLLDLLSYINLNHASAFLYRRRTPEEVSKILESSPDDDLYILRGKKVFAAVYEGREVYKSFLHGHSPAIGMEAASLLEALGELV